jgi:predicted transcriptional regulator
MSWRPIEMKGRRTSFEIYWEILVYCREPKTFTNIINRCDLNSKIGQQYLKFLAEKEYIIAQKDDDKTTYKTTENAQEYITLFSKLYGTLFDSLPGFRL